MPRAASAVVGDAGGRVSRVREFLAEKTERDLSKLPSGSDIYDFGSERDRLLERLADLRARRPVVFYGWQLRSALRPPGMAAKVLYTVSKSAITPTMYERADGTVR